MTKILQDYQNEPLCVASDFNCIKKDTEATNCSFRKRDTKNFTDFINHNSPWEVEIVNQQFTWFSKRDIGSKLDRVLVNEKWTDNQNWNVKGISRKSSDHSSLVLYSEKLDWGPIPVKIFDHWYSNENCKSMIIKSFCEMENSPLTIHQKMRMIRNQIQKWNKEDNEICEKAIAKLEEGLREADEQCNIHKATNIQHKLRSKYKELDSITRQKSRILWVEDEDKNSIFFHCAVKRRRWRNNIQGVRHKGEWIINPSTLKDLFARHFEERFQPPTQHQCLDMGLLLQCSIQQQISDARNNRSRRKKSIQHFAT